MRNTGFTLLEVTITTALAGVLAMATAGIYSYVSNSTNMVTNQLGLSANLDYLVQQAASSYPHAQQADYAIPHPPRGK